MDYTSARDVYTALRSEAHDADDPRVECAALNRLATLAETAGFDLEAQGAYLEAAQALAVASDDQAGKAETLWNLARHSVFRLALTEALSQSQQALELARGLDVQELVGRNLNWLALVESLVGAWTDALTHAEEAQAIFAALGDTVMRADSMAIAAGVYTMLGQPKRAVAVARQAYAMNLEIDNRAGVADAGEELARGLLDCGEYGEALEVSHATVSAARDSGQTMALIGTLALLGGIQRAIGAIDAALAAHREAEVRAESMHFPLFSEHIAAELCADYAALGDWAQAAKQARRALAARAQHSACYVGRTRWCETEALVRAGELAQAVDDVQRFGARVGGSPRLRIAYLRAQAVVDLAHRQLTQAIDGLEAARKLAQACDLVGELWPIAAALSKLYQQCGDAIEAERAMAEAQQITEGLATQLVDEDLRMALRAVVNRATQ
jgi:hypothetical protein